MVDHLPVPGETIGNGKLARAHGGKGANQAVAAAGDTFCGAFAVSLVGKDQDIIESVRFANAAGALSVTRQGAQTSIPDLKSIKEFLVRQ